MHMMLFSIFYNILDRSEEIELL